MGVIDSDLLSVQEARILLEKAQEARAGLASTGQKRLDQAVDCIAAALKPHVDELVTLAYEETDYGVKEHERVLLMHLLEELPAKLRGMSCVGLIERSNDRSYKVGIPKGIVVSLPSAWLAAEVTIHNVMLALKTGNPIIVIPHRRAIKTTCRVMQIITDALSELYFQEGSALVLGQYAVEGECELVCSDEVALVIETCREFSCDWNEKRGKDRFKGTIGNNLAFIEQSADLKKAARDIVRSKSFMNGLLPGVEQSVVAEASISEEFKAELVAQGAYFLKANEVELLQKVVYDEHGAPHREVMGKTALNLALRAGIAVPETTKILVVDHPFVSHFSPFSKEKYGPILSYYEEADWRNACEKCIELILNDRYGHSLSVYSKDQEVIRQFILKKPVARVLQNTASSFASVGLTSSLFLSYTLAVAGVGGGATANLQPHHFLLCRKAAEELIDFEELVRKNELLLASQQLLAQGKGEGIEQSVEQSYADKVSHITPCQGCIPVELFSRGNVGADEKKESKQQEHSQAQVSDIAEQGQASDSWFKDLLNECKSKSNDQWS